MKSFFSPEFFGGNRAKLKDLFSGTAPIVISANGLLQRSSDTEYPFRQDSNFWYLTGINLPDVILVIDKGKEYLIVPERSHERGVFDGFINTGELTRISGIKDVLEHKDGWKRLSSRLKRVKHIATLTPLPAYIEDRGLYVNPARARLIKRLKEIKDVELIDLKPQLIKQRVIKQEPELAAINAAIKATSAALKKVKKNIGKFRSEYEVEAELIKHFRANNFGVAYQTIVAAGKNACTLHYIENSARIKRKDLLLIDVGAEVENYAADITRTYAVSKPTRRQRAIHKAVVEIQEQALSLLGPGVVITDYEKRIEHLVGEKLRTLGLIKTINKDNVRKFSPHATSHFLGLDVHDSGDYKRPLEPGMVLTVEPGIYEPKEGIGVRVEDNVLITEKGVKILSRSLPRSL